MCSSIVVAKKELRKRMTALLGRLTQAHVTEASAQACRLVVESRQFQEASSISIFLSMPGEFDTAPLLRAAVDARKSVFVPRVCGPRRGDMQMIRLHDVNDIDGEGFEQSKCAMRPEEAAGACAAGRGTRLAGPALPRTPARPPLVSTRHAGADGEGRPPWGGGVAGTGPSSAPPCHTHTHTQLRTLALGHSLHGPSSHPDPLFYPHQVGHPRADGGVRSEDDRR